MLTKKVRGIVFDLDGTLVDSLSATFDAFNHGITLHGGKSHTPHEIMAYFGPGEGEIFARIVGPEKCQAAHLAYVDHIQANMHRVPLHKGVAELLERIWSAGVPVSIFTGRSWPTTEMILKNHGMLEKFITVITHDQVTASKPSPEGLFKCLKAMGMESDEVLMVGDSPADIRAARDAESRGVAALWDLMADRKELESHDPHHWAENPGQVWKIWESLKE